MTEVPEVTEAAGVTVRPVAFRGPQLAAWQEEALGAWRAGDRRGPRRGTLEVFTGGGKTLLAIRAYCDVSGELPRLAVVVPTQALQDQWVEELLRQTDLRPSEVGRVGGGRDDDWSGRRVLVAVLNSAAQKLPELCRGLEQELLLVIDECHRAGAPQWSRVLTTPAAARLGLSATPDRDEVDEAGELVAYDDQVLGRLLGEVVFTFDLRKAREIGWLPDYAIHHHGVTLAADERRDYDRLSRLVDDLADQLRSLGKEPGRARALMGRSDPVGQAAAGYVGATARRKDLLYRARERRRVTTAVLDQAFAANPARKVLLFHERIAECVALHASLVDALPVRSVLEHSQLSKAERRLALEDFAEGRASVLVSVKSLVEGLNVPAADVGMSVASSSSVRQRVQSLGRVLRRRFNGETKQADMHIVYVRDSVDELIYAKEDWSDLTGDGANRYLAWPLDAAEPVIEAGPPRTPKASEDAEWDRLERMVPPRPVVWRGVLPDVDFSVNARGTVTLPDGRKATGDQGVGALVEALRGTPGGRFKVTPRHRLVVVFQAQAGGPSVPYVVGQLPSPFEPAGEGTAEIDVAALSPGDPYPGPTDKQGGTFKLRQKGGGILERSTGNGQRAVAVLEGADPRVLNATTVLSAWRATGLPGGKVMINRLEHAYLPDGPVFLAHVPGGFLWSA